MSGIIEQLKLDYASNQSAEEYYRHDEPEYILDEPVRTAEEFERASNALFRGAGEFREDISRRSTT